MARPRKYNADYFPHDVNARYNSKIVYLERNMGIEGYAYYMKMLEYLASQDFYEIDINEEYVLETLPAQIACDNDKFDQFISLAIKCKLLKNDDGKIYSPGQRRRLKPLDNRREYDQNSYAQKNKENKIITTGNGAKNFSNENTPKTNSKAKQRKAEKSREKESNAENDVAGNVEWDAFSAKNFREILMQSPFELSADKIDELIIKYGEHKIKFQIENLLWKMKNQGNINKDKGIKDPIKYFIASLNGDYERPKGITEMYRAQKPGKHIDEQMLVREAETKLLNDSKRDRLKTENKLLSVFKALPETNKKDLVNQILDQMSQDSEFSPEQRKIEDADAFRKSGYDLKLLNPFVRGYIMLNLPRFLNV